MIKKIIKFPAPSLRNPCKLVEFPLSDEMKGHLNDLRDTLNSTPNGIALASNQIAAEGHRVFVVRPTVDWPLVRSMSGESVPEVVVNPVIHQYLPHEIDYSPTFHRDLYDYKCFVEGCLSVPELNAPNEREYWIEMTYNDEEGYDCVYIAKGLTARMFQHEVDHLDGKLIYDYADKKVQLAVKQQAIKNRKAGR